jgi:hypothetical protein
MAPCLSSGRLPSLAVSEQTLDVSNQCRRNGGRRQGIETVVANVRQACSSMNTLDPARAGDPIVVSWTRVKAREKGCVPVRCL